MTGASAGIGLEFARQMARRGCDVAMTARRADRLEAEAAAIRRATGRRVTTVPADLGDPDGALRLIEALDSSGVEPDYVVNNAGVGVFGAVVETPVDKLAGMLRLNMEALTVLSAEYGRRMAARGRGAILNIASTAAYQPVPYLAAYAATKAYVLHFSEAFAAELSGKGVRVFTLCPGATKSEFAEVAGAPNIEFVATSAEDCVRRALDAFDNRGIVYVDGLANLFGTYVGRFAPRPLLVRAVAAALGR